MPSNPLVALAVALALAGLAGCGSPAATPAPPGGGGGGSTTAPPVPAPAVNLSGTWRATYALTVGNTVVPAALGSGILSLTQTGDQVTGTLVASNQVTPVTGTVEGTILVLQVGPVTRNGVTYSLSSTTTIVQGLRGSGPCALVATGPGTSVRLTGVASYSRIP